MQQASFLFLLRFLPALFLFLFLLTLQALFFRTRLLHAFRSRTPDRFRSLMPAFLAEVAGGRHVAATDTALV